MIGRRRTYFKVLGPEGRPINGGRGRWNLPLQDEDGNWTAGAWMRREPHPILCHSGYHLTTLSGLPYWLSTVNGWEANDMHVYLAEGSWSRTRIDDHGKRAFASARLLRELNWGQNVARLWAADVIDEVVAAQPAAQSDELNVIVANLRDLDRTPVNVYEDYDDGVIVRHPLFYLFRRLGSPEATINKIDQFTRAYSATKTYVPKLAARLLRKHLFSEMRVPSEGTVN